MLLWEPGSSAATIFASIPYTESNSALLSSSVSIPATPHACTYLSTMPTSSSLAKRVVAAHAGRIRPLSTSLKNKRATPHAQETHCTLNAAQIYLEDHLDDALPPSPHVLNPLSKVVSTTLSLLKLCFQKKKRMIHVPANPHKQAVRVKIGMIKESWYKTEVGTSNMPRKGFWVAYKRVRY